MFCLKKNLLVFSLILLFMGQAALLKAEQSNYMIEEGDVLEINVWKEPELTRTLKVRVDGKISLPLLDDIQAAGRTPVELKNKIEEKLSEFIEGPEVTVIVQNQSGQYYLIGEVAGTGAYPLQKNLTVVQAIAQAGGFTEWADKDEILILRRKDGQEQRINVDYESIVSGKNPEQNILLQPYDTLVVK